MQVERLLQMRLGTLEFAEIAVGALMVRRIAASTAGSSSNRRFDRFRGLVEHLADGHARSVLGSDDAAARMSSLRKAFTALAIAVWRRSLRSRMDDASAGDHDDAGDSDDARDGRDDHGLVAEGHLAELVETRSRARAGSVRRRGIAGCRTQSSEAD